MILLISSGEKVARALDLRNRLDPAAERSTTPMLARPGGVAPALRHREVGQPRLTVATGENAAHSGVMDAWTIEVADGHGASAAAWRRAHGERLVEAALTHGAKEWTWVVRDWGVLLELTFATDADWQRFRATPAVQAALDAVPDPARGRWVYPGHGGGSASRVPRRPKPIRSAGGASIPEPEPEVAPWQQPLGRRQSKWSTAERGVRV